MPSPAAVRQRRYRKHRAGDHSLCLQGNCKVLTPAVTVDGASPGSDADQLGPAGATLWREVMASNPPPLQRVLLLEACRIADRLSRLDRQLDGEDWLRFRINEDGDEIRVIVDGVLAEARQQATALKSIVAELRQATARPAERKPPAEKPAAVGAPGQEVAGVTSIAGRLAAKRGAATTG